MAANGMVPNKTRPGIDTHQCPVRGRSNGCELPISGRGRASAGRFVISGTGRHVTTRMQPQTLKSSCALPDDRAHGSACCFTGEVAFLYNQILGKNSDHVIQPSEAIRNTLFANARNEPD